MMKKAIAFFVSVMLLVGCMGVIAHAAGTCNVVVVPDKTQAAVGETVTFKVMLSGAGNVDMGVWNHYVTATVPANMEIISANPGEVYDGIWATVSGNTVTSSAQGAFEAGVTSDAVLFTFSAKVISGNYNDQLTVSVGGSVSVKETVEHEDAMGNIVTSIDSVTQQVAGGNAIITIPCTDHKAGDPVIENNVEPTCGAAGSYDSVVYCSICGTEMSRETITVPATGKHTPGAAVKENEKAATCGADGSYDNVVYCTVCKTELERNTIIVPATGDHKYETVKGQAATCTTDGLTDGEKCSVCGYVKTEQKKIPALGHSYEEKITKAPTCDEEGEKTFTCKNDASHTYTEKIDAIGHDWDDGKVTKEPDCTEKGVKTYTCKNDASHTKTEEIPALGHTPGKPVEENRVESTCTKTGSVDIVVYCSVCGEEISRDKQTIPLKDHVDKNKDDKCDICGGDMSDDEPKNGDITPYFVMPVVLVSVCAAAAYVTIKRKNAR